MVFSFFQVLLPGWCSRYRFLGLVVADAVRKCDLAESQRDLDAHHVWPNERLRSSSQASEEAFS